METMLAILDTDNGKLVVTEIASGLFMENTWWWVPCSTLCADLITVAIILTTEMVDTAEAAELTTEQNHRVEVIGMEQIVVTLSKPNLAFFSVKQASVDGVHLVVEALIHDQQEAAVVAQDREVEDLVNNFKIENHVRKYNSNCR